jgi:hypothetical protein
MAGTLVPVQWLPNKVKSVTGSPVPVLRENVIAVLHYRMARESALGVVSLRRIFRLIAGPKSIGRRVILERGPPPSAAVRGKFDGSKPGTDEQVVGHRSTSEQSSAFP